MSKSALVLVLFISWTLLLLVVMEVTGPLAPWLLGARIVQSGIHLTSTCVAAVNPRFTVFAMQMAIAVYWAWALVVG